MRWTLLIALLLYAAPSARSEEERTWRAYDLGAHWVPNRGFENHGAHWRADLFELVGPAVPSKVQRGPNAREQDRPAPVARALELLEVAVPNARTKAGATQILVYGTEAEHGVAAHLIDRSREHAYLHVEIRELVLPKRRLAGLARTALDALLDGSATRETVERLKSLDAARGTRGGTLHAVPGLWTPLEQVRRVRYLSDFDVEIAQAASIADPIVRTGTEGLRVAVRGLPLTDGRVVLNVAASTGAFSGGLGRFELAASDPPESLAIRDTNYGAVEQADFRGACVATDLLLRPGRPAGVLLKSPDGSSDAAHVLLFRLRAGAVARSAARGEALLPIGAFTQPHPYFGLRTLLGGSLRWRGTFERSENAAYRLDGIKEELERQLETDDGGYVEELDVLGGAVLVRASPARVAAMKDTLAALERQLLHPVRCAIELRRGAPGGGQPVGELNATLLAGGHAALGAYRRVDHVGDYDVEVAQESRIADPIHRIANEGVLANVSVWRSGDGYRMRLDLEVSALGPEERIEPDAGGVGPLQRYPRAVRESTYHLELDPGVPATIDLGPAPGGEPGERLEARVKVAPAGQR